MSKKYVLDNFTFDNLDTKSNFNFLIESVTNIKIKEVIKDNAELVFVNNSTGKILSKLLKIENLNVNNNHNIKASKDDEIYVVQITGPDIPENCETLPEENFIYFLKITLK